MFAPKLHKRPHTAAAPREYSVSYGAKPRAHTVSRAPGYTPARRAARFLAWDSDWSPTDPPKLIINLSFPAQWSLFTRRLPVQKSVDAVDLY